LAQGPRWRRRGKPHAMGAACARPEPPSPAEATVPPSSLPGFGQLDIGEAFEVELEHGWVRFDDSVSTMLADAEAHGQPQIEYVARKQSYVIDLRSMQQFNKRSGKTRRIRRVQDAEALRPSKSAGGAGAPEVESAHGLHARAVHTPSAPAAFPDLLRLGDSELGRLKASPAALDEWIMQQPEARALTDQVKDLREENDRLKRAAISRLARLAQQADEEAETGLQAVLEAPEPMSVTAFASFKEQYLQLKAEKQRKLLLKKHHTCDAVEWHTLCMTPATTRVGS